MFMTKSPSKVTAAALALLVGMIAGCGDSSTDPPDPAVATTVTLSPSTLNFSSVGETQQLTATVLDQDGARISGASVTWVPSSSSVASVSSTGLVTAVANGTATITATSGTASGTASVVVVFPAPTVTLVSPSVAFVWGGITITITGTGFTANSAGPNAVTVGGTACASPTTNSDTSITCTVPSGATGPADVVVTNNNGAGTLAGAVTYQTTLVAAEGGGMTAPPGGAFNFYYIDDVTAAATLVGPIGFGVTCMDFHPTTGVLYATTAPTGGGLPRQLITIDPTTGAGTLVGSLVEADMTAHRMPGCAFVGGTLYGGDGMGLNFISVDVSTGIVTVIGPNGVASPSGAFVSDPADANQYYFPAGIIYSTDITTGVMTAGATITGTGGGTQRGGAFHNGATFAISSGAGGQLVTIDMTTGVGSVIGTPTTSHRLDALASPTR